MLSRMQERQLDQSIGVVLWYIFESNNIPPGNKRLQLCNIFRKEPLVGKRAIYSAIMDLMDLMPLNPFTLTVSLNGPTRTTDLIYSLATCYLGEMEGVILLQLLPVWAGLGFPVIEMPAHLMEKLLEFEFPTKSIDSMKQPFPAFEIALPEGLFNSKHDDGTTYPLHSMLVGKLPETFGSKGPPPVVEDGFALMAHTDHFALWSSQRSISRMGLSKRKKEDAEKKPYDYEVLEEDSHTLRRLAQVWTHACKMIEFKGGLGLDGEDILVPSFKDKVMPEFTKRIYEIVPTGHEYQR